MGQLGGEGLRWQSIIVPTHPKYKIKRIKSKGLSYGLKHREKEAQLCRLQFMVQPTMSLEEDKLGKVALFYLGGYNLTLLI